MTDTTSAQAIERDIEQTQNNISETVEQLQKRLNPRSLIDSLLGDEDASSQQLITAAKNNPLAVGLIGVGALLLASGKSPSLSSLRSSTSGSTDGDSATESARRAFGGRGWLRGQDHHASYLEHMSRCQPQVGEDDAAYRRRRDLARADFFMIDQHHDEDEGSFRTRLNEAQEKLRSKTAAFGEKIRRAGHDTGDSLSSARSAFAGRGRQAYSSARDWTGNTASQLSDQYSANPAIGGLVAAALGAAFGAAIPPSAFEREKLGGLGEQARDLVSEGKDKALGIVAEQKDKLVEKANTLLDEQGEKTRGQSGTGGTGGTGEASAFNFSQSGAHPS